MFIASATEPGRGRRVDFGQIVSLLAESDDPPQPPLRDRAGRLALVILIVLGLIGDTLLIVRPEALMAPLAGIRAIHGVAKGVAL
jgi:hypothetical protein